MTLEELIDTLESANMLRIFKGDEEIFVGYLALFAPEVGHTNCKLYEQYKNDKVIRFRAVPEITHRKWKELNLMSPLKPDETPDFRFQELQMKLYYTICHCGTVTQELSQETGRRTAFRPITGGQETGKNQPHRKEAIHENDRKGTTHQNPASEKNVPDKGAKRET